MVIAINFCQRLVQVVGEQNLMGTFPKQAMNCKLVNISPTGQLCTIYAQFLEMEGHECHTLVPGNSGLCVAWSFWPQVPHRTSHDVPGAQ